MSRKFILKVLLIGSLLGAFSFIKYMGWDSFLNLSTLKNHHSDLVGYVESSPFISSITYFAIYVIVTAISIPGAVVLTLAGGAVFGLPLGTLIISFASTFGATLAFLSSRFIFRDWVRNKFKDKIARIEKGIEKEGSFYLFSLRLVPIFPFFLINLVMGLTPMKTAVFFFVSQVGMLPGTIVYVNAGTQLAEIDSLKGILSPSLLFSFALIGLLPWVLKPSVAFLKRRRYSRHYKKPKSFDYNMIVIGGGSAGLVSAYIAAATKAKVALVEKNKMGGDCLNTGCVPSKALIRSARLFHDVKNASKFGIDVNGAVPDFSRVMKRVHQIIKDIEPHDSVERYESLGVDCYGEKAEIVSPYCVKIGDETYTTKNIIIATGASPFVPRIPGIENIDYLTSENLWELEENPEKMVVLGGGPIGCELSQAFARLGSKVTQVEMGPQLMGREDEDVSRCVQKSLEKDGVQVLINHKAIEFKEDTLICQKDDGSLVEVPFDKVLLALGRQPNTQGLGLESLNAEFNGNETLAVDEFLRLTRFPNIYACGDVAGPYQFTHTAAHQAWFASVNALFSPLKKFKVDYRVIPWCTFVDPEVAHVGLSEKEAKERGHEFEVTKYGIDDLDRAITEGEAKGFVKVITPKGKDKILGVTIVGHHAGDIIAEYILAMKYGIGLNKILGTIHIYPTLSEANKFAAGVWKKNHAPGGVLNWLEKFHRWRR